MLRVEGLGKYYQKGLWSAEQWAFRDLHFQLPRSGVVGLVGANGAGKTTLLKVLLRLTRPSVGEVIYAPSLGKSWKDVRSHIGLLPERAYYPMSASGRELIEYFAKLSDLPKKWGKEKLRSEMDVWVERVKLTEAINSPLRTYSKGMLQRIGLVTAVLHRPSIIFLDEPTSGLDPWGRKLIREIIEDLAREERLVLFSGHVMEDIYECCQYVLALGGRAQQFWGDVGQWQQTMGHRYQVVVKEDGKKKNKRYYFMPDELNKGLSELISLERKIIRVGPGAIASYERDERDGEIDSAVRALQGEEGAQDLEEGGEDE